MQVIVKPLNGGAVAVNATTLSAIDEEVSRLTGVPAGISSYRCHGKVLRDEDCSEFDGTLMTMLAVRGGHCQVPCGIFDDPRYVIRFWL